MNRKSFTPDFLKLPSCYAHSAMGTAEVSAGNSGGAELLGSLAQKRYWIDQFRGILQSDFNLNTTLSFSGRKLIRLFLSALLFLWSWVSFGKESEHLQSMRF